MVSHPFNHGISSSILPKSSPTFSPATSAMFLSLSSSSFLAPPSFRIRNLLSSPFLSPKILSSSRGPLLKIQCNKLGRAMMAERFTAKHNDDLLKNVVAVKDDEFLRESLKWASTVSCGALLWLTSAQAAYSSTDLKLNAVYEVGALFELGIQLSYLLLLLVLLGVGSFFVIRQVLLRRELDLSAKELQEQVRSGDANATELFELGAVMLRRKYYPAANKYLLQAIDKWDGDEQDVAQVYNALGVSYVRDGKLDKGILQFETAVKIQPGYVTAWNNLGDAYEKKKDLKAALKAFEEVLLFDPNNQVARPRVDSLRALVKMYKGVPIRSKLKGDEY